uniref:GON domain-containing protein n=1 Tax=Heterorhabditis bacteriophora TaxID=37862 RepID=A0A1I7XFA5_HETBA
MSRDKCGICGGDDSTCRTVKGIYNERGSFGYNAVMKIPAGSANIDIRQHGYNNQKDDDNYLSLRAANGDFLLNGHYQVSVFRQQIPIQDVILEYSGSDNIVERINGTGPIRWVTEDITHCSAECGSGEKKQRVYCVKVHNGRQSITRESDCDRNNRPSERIACFVDCSGRRWSYSEWTQCSNTCGSSGVSMRKVVCVDDNNRVVDEKMCQNQAKEATDRECNRFPCPRWVYAHWSECSRSCDGGVRMRHAQCMDAADKEVHYNRCGPKHDRESCNEHMCTSWAFGHWSHCSVTCGDGIQTRDAVCVDRENRQLDSGIVLKICFAPAKCNYRERIVQKPCSRPSCPSWKIGEWTQCSCSVTCGTGMRHRSVECIYRDQIVDQSFCGDAVLPIKQQTCTLIPCTSWSVSQWSSCSTTCGTGEQTRRVFCSSGQNREIVKDYMCDMNSRPREKKVCDRDECEARRVFIDSLPNDVPPIRWATGPWAECSTSCGQGLQRRQLKCRDNIRDLPPEYCAHLEKVEDVRTCMIKPCAYWKTGPWMSCTATCGTHVQQSRSVLCVPRNSTYNVTDTDCDVSQRPPSLKSCKLNACPKGEPPLGKWVSGEWTKCSATCGGGWRRRSISCSLSICDDSNKPKMFDECNLQRCPPKTNNAWQISPWTHCSVTCGGGVQLRRVWCEDSITLRMKEDGECGDVKPLEQRDCELSPCLMNLHEVPVQWKAAAWSPCSVKCGRGVRRRVVACIESVTNATVATTRCDSTKRPIDEHKCRVMHCPRWRGMPWGSCVDSCSRGEQHRRVFCMSNTGKRAAPRMCNTAQVPLTTRLCDISKCPYEWVPGPWNTCSKTCGKGTQLRFVECRVKHGNTTRNNEPAVPKEKCESLPMPVDSQMCDLNVCESEFQWQIGPWGMCSQTCGQGVRRRKVRCYDRTGKVVARTKCEVISPRPRRTQICFQRNCLPSTCQEIRSQKSSTHSIDGNYTVLMDGFPITVYCVRMNETIPSSYLNLDRETNFAEVYGKRLIYPHTCPSNGERNDTCQCSDDGHANAGLTHFRKVRVDLLNRKININDFTFADKLHGSFVPFGTAGDCYSMKDCPQGRFSVDLRGTGLRIVDDLQWEDKGHRTTSRIDRSWVLFPITYFIQLLTITYTLNTFINHRLFQNNARIEGRCGGYCGMCAPDKYKGLVFGIDQKQLGST